MLLETAREQLRWPSREQIMSPIGAGTQVFARLVKSKIGQTLQLLDDARGVSCGILTANPLSSATEAPIAIVCDFPRPVSEATIREAHRLAWNFSRSPLLITIEPHLIRSWTCCEQPPDPEINPGQTAEIQDARLWAKDLENPSEQAAHALQWIRLVSGDFFRHRPDRFRRDGCADRTLLKELSVVRKSLKEKKTKAGESIRLDDDTIHDLLARVIFIQFLWDRKDGEGKPALDKSILDQLHREGHLSRPHDEISSVLCDHGDAYGFFKWLNDRFNGDLFPGKGDTQDIRDAEWRDEMAKVRPEHLSDLSDFISGSVTGRERWLWRLYSFDVIPLEFISSVYEEFVTEDGAHYTPGFLVDHILDGVLDWEGTDWNLALLDPSCGSGIFLVKAYQRLIERWKNAHPGSAIDPPMLRRILENNIFGVDVDRHAVRVASFSLYLTMCDEIDPNDYLRSLVFPRLRNRTLINADFFREDLAPFRTDEDARRFDLVIGNAPWGTQATEPAMAWAADSNHRWPILYKDIGTLFLPKALALTSISGVVTMVQPASSLLFNISGPALSFRKKLFTEYQVDEVINLSAMRFTLFEGAKSPACIITIRPVEPNGDPIAYSTPKSEVGSQSMTGNKEALYQLVIDSFDINFILPEEASDDPLIWPVMTWGSRRDLHLIRRLRGFPSLKSLQKSRNVITRQGANWGNKEKYHPESLGLPMIGSDADIDNSFAFLDARLLSPNEDAYVDKAAGVSMEAFQLPQMIVKQSWQQGPSRFKAVIISSDAQTGPVYCTKSYFSVHARNDASEILDAAWLGLSSSVAVYCLLLSSGRFASAVPEPNKDDIMEVPIPEKIDVPLREIKAFDFAEVDRKAFEAFGLDDVDRSLVSDLFNYTLQDFKGTGITSGRRPTSRRDMADGVHLLEPELQLYADYFIKVLKSGFGSNKRIKCRIYQEKDDQKFPLRLIAFHLDWEGKSGIEIERIDSALLAATLDELDLSNAKSSNANLGAIFYQRVARIYSQYTADGKQYPTVYLVKPDRIRYWTRSAALRDADEISGDVRTWMRDPA